MTILPTSRQPPLPDCPLDRYLHVISGAWVPRIIWFLRFGPRRFGDLRRDIGSISTKVLTEKLRMLEKENLILRQVLNTSPTQVEYSLSERGEAFNPLFEAMIQIAQRLDKIDKNKQD